MLLAGNGKERKMTSCSTLLSRFLQFDAVDEAIERGRRFDQFYHVLVDQTRTLANVQGQLSLRGVPE